MIPLRAGWLAGVCCRFFTLPSSVPLSHVHVVCFKDDLVPVPSYFRSLERLPHICASYVPHLVFLSVYIYMCVYSSSPCLCSYPVASYVVVRVKQVSEMPPKQPVNANAITLPRETGRRVWDESGKSSQRLIGGCPGRDVTPTWLWLQLHGRIQQHPCTAWC